MAVFYMLVHTVEKNNTKTIQIEPWENFTYVVDKLE